MVESPEHTLVHDVGKYIARTARNLGTRDGGIPRALVEMLWRDLYELDGKRRASVVFMELAARLDPTIRGTLSDVEAALHRIDELEPDVRAGTGDAVAEARDLAVWIEQRLRGLLE